MVSRAQAPQTPLGVSESCKFRRCHKPIKVACTLSAESSEASAEFLSSSPFAYGLGCAAQAGQETGHEEVKVVKVIVIVVIPVNLQ